MIIINYKNDYNYILSSVKINGLILEFASDKLQKNYNIVLEAVKQNGLSLKNAYFLHIFFIKFIT